MISILYVDDEPGLLDIGKIFLERGGQFSVDTCTSAPEALAMLDSKNFDAIISDYQMPGMDGIEFLKKVRASGNAIPFIILTGRGREEIAINALNEGATFYFQKGGKLVSQFAEISHEIRHAVQQRWAEEAIRDFEQREADIINFLPDATFVIDQSGQIIAWNHAIEEMTGIPAVDMLGKGDYEYAIPFCGERQPILIDLVFESDEVIAEKYAHVRHKNDTLIADITILLQNNTPVTLMCIASPLYNQQGEVVGAIESVRDITERRLAEEALAATNNKLKLLSGITRNDITSQVSIIKGYLTGLERKQSDTLSSEYFKKINSSVQRILSMIQFTREYEEIGGNAPLWHDFCTLIDTAAQQVPSGNLQVKNEVPAGLEVFADPLMTRVFYNLMDNAVRYGGKITTIRFFAANRERELIIVCEDDGAGVPYADKKKIFEQGYGKNAGLGLFLTREILSVTGITITETGEPGKGARFELAIPEGIYRSVDVK